MKKSQFIETKIVAVLKEADARMKVEDICRKHKINMKRRVKRMLPKCTPEPLTVIDQPKMRCLGVQGFSPKPISEVITEVRARPQWLSHQNNVFAP